MCCHTATRHIRVSAPQVRQEQRNPEVAISQLSNVTYSSVMSPMRHTGPHGTRGRAAGRASHCRPAGLGSYALVYMFEKAGGFTVKHEAENMTVADLVEAAVAAGVRPSELIERVAPLRAPSAHED